MLCWLKTDQLKIISHLSLHSIADAAKIMIMAAAEQGDIGDSSSPDVQHAVDGHPIYPPLLATAAPRAVAEDSTTPEDDDYDNG